MDNQSDVSNSEHQICKIELIDVKSEQTEPLEDDTDVTPQNTFPDRNHMNIDIEETEVKPLYVTFNSTQDEEGVAVTKENFPKVRKMHFKRIKNGESRAFECLICGKISKEKYIMQRHIWQHTGEFPLSCSICGAKFRFKKSVISHMKREHDLKVIIRDIAKDGSLKTRKNETKEGVSENEFVIKQDKENGERYRILEKGNKKLFECMVCNQILCKRQIFERHYMRHAGVYPYSCRLCNYKTNRKDVMWIHLSKRHKATMEETDALIITDVKIEKNNHRTLKVDLNLRKKSLVILKRGAKEFYKCKLCEKMSNTLQSFFKHFRIHSGSRPYVCSICGYRCSQMQYLKLHLNVRHNIEEKKKNTSNWLQTERKERKFIGRTVLCKICKQEILKRSFRKHMFKHSAPCKFRICTICGYKNRTQQLMIDHVMIEHKEIYSANNRKIMKEVHPYICKFCNYPYSHRSLFEQHMRIHTGIKKIRCPLCAYITYRKDLMTQHFNEKHRLKVENDPFEENSVKLETGVHIIHEDSYPNILEKRYQCKHCSYVCNTRAPYRVHLKQHKTNKRYECKHCSYISDTRAPYRLHLKHHRTDVIKINLDTDVQNSTSSDVISNNSDSNPSQKTYYTKIMDGEVTAFKCLVCGKTSKEKYIIQRHIWQHTDESPLSCSICGDKFRFKKSVLSHLKRKHDLEVYYRDIANDGSLKSDFSRKYGTKEGVSGNRFLIKKEKEEPGDTEHSDYSNSTSTGRLKKESGGKDRYVILRKGRVVLFECIVCRKRFKLKSRFNAHYSTHSGKLPYSCEICGHKGRSKRHIKDHMRRWHKICAKQEDIVDPCSDAESEPEQEASASIMEIIGDPYTTIEHCGMKLLKCVVCNRICHSRQQFGQHFIVHKQDFIYSCKKCLYRTRDEDYLHRHVKTHQEKVPIKPVNIDGERYRILQRGDKKSFECMVCNQILCRRQTFERHYVKHTGIYPYNCSLCVYKTQEKDRLLRHLCKQHSMTLLESKEIIRNDVKVEEIHRRPKVDVRLRRKSLVILKRGAKEFYKCKLCEKMSNTLQNFFKHFRIHSGSRPYVCSVCDFRCSEVKHLKLHLNVRHNIDQKKKSSSNDVRGERKERKYIGKKVLCKICKREILKRGFRKHMFNHSMTRKRYFCSICRYKNRARQLLINHVKTQHMEISSVNGGKKIIKEIQEYICKFCNIPFSHRSLFEQHMRTHIGTKKIRCPQCAYVTYRKDLVKQHVNDKHQLKIEDEVVLQEVQVMPENSDSSIPKIGNGNKPYLCRNCFYISYTRAAHRLHTQQHKTSSKGVPLSSVKRSLNSDDKDNSSSPDLISDNPDSNQSQGTHYTVIMDGEVKAYECITCGRRTKERYLMQRHVWQHTGEFPLSCSICGAKVRLKKSMKFHLKKEHGLVVDLRDIAKDGSLKTDIIRENEGEEEDVGENQHTIKQEMEETDDIEHSNGKFTATDNLHKNAMRRNRYIIVRKGKIVIYECTTCRERFRSKARFITHYSNHSGKLPYSCEICGHQGRSKGIIKNHMRRLHKVHVKYKDIRDPCSESEPEEDASTSMMEIIGDVYTIIEQDGVKLQKCVVCNRTYENKHQFSAHFIAHKQDFCYSCEMCLYRSRNQDYLHRHVQTNHKVMVEDEVKPEEPIISHGSSSNNTETKPEEVLRIVLEYEGEGHVNLQQGNAIVYKCIVCKKISKTRNLFIRHFIMHKEEFPYSCKICVYKAREKYYLKQHMMLRHNTDIDLEDITKDDDISADKPRYIVVSNGNGSHFKCSLCDKSFKSKVQFEKHHRVHSQEFLFSCTLCKYKAKVKRYMKAHMKAQHGIEVEMQNIRKNCEDKNDPLGIVTSSEKKLDPIFHKASYKCEYCPYISTSTLDFSNHQKTHSMDNESVGTNAMKLPEVVYVKEEPQDDYTNGINDLVRHINDKFQTAITKTGI